jgi:hypothetical protein
VFQESFFFLIFENLPDQVAMAWEENKGTRTANPNLINKDVSISWWMDNGFP